MKKILKGLLIGIFLTLFGASSALALVSYMAIITVSNSNTTPFDMLPSIVPAPNSYLASNHLIASNGLDTAVQSGATIIPSMLADNKTLLCDNLSASGNQQYSFVTNQTPKPSFELITGYGGYITTSDSPNLEPSANFSITWNGYVNTDNGTNKYLVQKNNAVEVLVSPIVSENITARMFGTSALRESYVGSDDTQRSIYGSNWRCQTFSSSVGFSITGVEIYQYLIGVPDDIIFSIRMVDSVTGKPIGGDLTSGTANANAWGTPAWSNNVTIGSYTIEPDVTYALVAQVPAGSVPNHVEWSVDSTAPTYTNGQYGASADDGVTWTMDASMDCNFRIYGYTITSSVSILSVSSGSTSVTTRANGTLFELLTGENLLWNSDYEVGDPPTGWTLSGVGATANRSITQVKVNTYSANLTSGAGALASLYQDVSDPSYYDDKTITYGGWVYATVANNARLYIYDLTGISYSSYHTGIAGWEWLTVTRTIPSPAVIVRLGNREQLWGVTAYYDGAKLVEGSTISQTPPIPKTIASVTSVLDNSNNITWNQGNVMPYADNISVSINGTQQLYYAPNSIILVATLPDRSTDVTSNPGIITWGSNPSGVTAVMGSLIPSSVSTTITVPASSQDVAPKVKVRFGEYTPTNPPPVNPFSYIINYLCTGNVTGVGTGMYSIPPLVGWLLLAFVSSFGAYTGTFYLTHLGWLAGIFGGGVIGLFVAMHVVPWFLLAVSVLFLFVGILQSER